MSISPSIHSGTQFYLQITQYLPLPRKRSPDSATTDWWPTSNCSLLLIYQPQKYERLSWPSWMTYSRRFTHISDRPSAVGGVHYRESLPVKDQRLTSSSRMRFMSHNWLATKQRLHPQSAAEISRHSVLSETFNHSATQPVVHFELFIHLVIICYYY